MNADIRPARASDIGALVALENAVFETDRMSRNAFRRMIVSKSASILIAERDGLLAGHCVVLLRAGSNKARLYSLAVAPNSGGGLGRALLEAAENAAAAKRRKAMRLEVREDNLRAIDLYEKNGYRQIGHKPAYYADGADALRYEKPLVRSASDDDQPLPKKAGTG
ncbi:GNAT family N-acetyltransferase [Mesorhizobium sp. CGMCC 1.15528]|uniref:GNAT family N-acetyltransferase n=1 Tax=Mesorhizobium zhangyense TaxID=1776730 RepID=A0A7C9VAT2_9HYPH|nr:GNAT family N-acetyltransferase [Mesorhizobium zhangyense]NGN40690.1 GNAT family N-acetyltransferase [Mesorhizobium zhangyense]